MQITVVCSLIVAMETTKDGCIQRWLQDDIDITSAETDTHVYTMIIYKVHTSNVHTLVLSGIQLTLYVSGTTGPHPVRPALGEYLLMSLIQLTLSLITAPLQSVHGSFVSSHK